MGASLSGGVSDGEGLVQPRLGDIPESCVALILIQMDPPEICKLARLNRAFRGASLADFIWESKLPPNYRFIVDRVFDESTKSKISGKRDTYARLCRSNSFDDGTKVIWLDKHKGGICLSISSKALSITGIDDRRYWNFIANDESRFQTVAYLQQIWWFEVNGEFEFQFPLGKYGLFFRLHLGRSLKRLGRRVCNSEHVHGWDIKPVRFELSTSNGHRAVSQCYLDNPGNWINYHVGDFVVDNPHDLIKIKYSMTQIDCTHTKGGVCVDSVLIYPSSVAKEP
ncbi:F-box protein PP2-A13 [Pyrus ussuriensis x Pyrus communis]|uniref:F-box protein PP2-A13 n=1 Tax=Pyrus ussuriensis x Pyrus communis TaxID=2448454 RepID=A0A5N5F8V2_9ROSA|nr:F-box protein PP2-A13 [Pyrus ussuriensis x Pyrus communis]